MANILLTNLKKINELDSYIFDCQNVHDKDFVFEIDEHKNVKILIKNCNEKTSFNFNVKNDSNLTISFLQISKNCIDFNSNVEKNSNITVYFADFVNGDLCLNANVYLNDENASCVWNLASLCLDGNNKNHNVSVIHNSKKTICNINNYGVARGKCKILFSGICHIKNGCHDSVAHQNAKIMVFDSESDAVAKPILKIDDNSIEASHAAVVGKINDEHLFYLTSRGLSEIDAKKLITFGYLKPILIGFDDAECNSIIENKISEGI